MMLEIPKRVSLAVQIAESIRTGINKQVWREFLPGERRLSQLFRVSRPTISSALNILEKDGLIIVRHGCRNRIVSGERRAPVVRNRLVAIITHEPLAVVASTAYNS